MRVSESLLVEVGQRWPGARVSRAARYSQVQHVWLLRVGDVWRSLCGRQIGGLGVHEDNPRGWPLCHKCEMVLVGDGVLRWDHLVEV